MATQGSEGSARRGSLISIDAILRARSQLPIASSRERGWTGVTVDLHGPRLSSGDNFPGLDHHLINFCPSGHARMIQRRGGTVHEGVISAGMSLIMPAGYASAWEGQSAASARLRIPKTLVAHAADEVGKRSAPQAEIRNIFEVRDPLIERLSLILVAELNLKPHPAQPLIVEAVSMALAAHLVRRYNEYEPPEPEEGRGLGHVELRRLTAYIEDNIDRTIGLAELAAVVNVSRFHFTRLFKRSTGQTAISFVEQCRIRRAQSLIAETDLPLAEIALTAGFADQSHFTRRFHRQVGCTPAAYARERGRRRFARR